jgi:hypothetical protein
VAGSVAHDIPTGSSNELCASQGKHRIQPLSCLVTSVPTGDHGRRRLGSQSSSDDCIAKNQPPRPAIRDDRHHDVGRCDDPHAPRHLSKAASSGTCRRRGNLSICCTGDRWLWDRDRAPSVGARRFVIRPPGRRFRHMRRDRRKLLSGRARPARGEPKRSRIPHVGPVAGSGMRGQNQSGYSQGFASASISDGTQDRRSSCPDQTQIYS